MAISEFSNKFQADKKSTQPKYLKSILKDNGEIIKSGIDVLAEKKNLGMISISPAIDLALGGGVREGCWLTLTGDPKSGKTTTAMQIAANCQSEGRPIIYLDAEGRLKDMNFQVEGFDTSKIHVIAPVDKPLSAEVFLEAAYKMMSHPDYTGAVLIIDSVSSLLPQKEIEGDFSPGRAGLPKILSIFTKKIGQLLPKQRGLVIAITHYIANTGGFGKAKMSDGGNKIQYQADTRMEIAGSGMDRPARKGWVDENGTRIGQIVNWKIICSSCGPPGGQVQSYIRYGKGIDKVQENIQIGMDLGLVSKSGAWCTCDFVTFGNGAVNEKEFKAILKKARPDIDVDNEEELLSTKGFKFQGQIKLYNFMAENPDFMNLLTKMTAQGLE